LRVLIDNIPPIEYEEISPSHPKAITLSVSIFDPDEEGKEMRRAAKALARECKRREFDAFGKLPTHPAIEQSQTMSEQGVTLRVIKMWDVIKWKMVIRVDVLGACLLPEVTSKEGN
jgi:hypothetical protein